MRKQSANLPTTGGSVLLIQATPTISAVSTTMGLRTTTMRTTIAGWRFSDISYIQE